MSLSIIVTLGKPTKVCTNIRGVTVVDVDILWFLLHMLYYVPDISYLMKTILTF